MNYRIIVEEKADRARRQQKQIPHEVYKLLQRLKRHNRAKPCGWFFTLKDGSMLSYDYLYYHHMIKWL